MRASVQTLDKAAAKSVSAALAAEAAGAPATKEEAKFFDVARTSGGEHLERLSDAWMKFKDFRQPFKRQPAAVYGETLTQLTRSGWPQTSAAMFQRFVDVMSDLPLQEVAPVLPTPKTVDFWIAKTKGTKKEVLGRVQGGLEAYFETVLIDWAGAKAPISKLGPLVALLAVKEERPSHLLSPASLLVVVLKRDKSGSLAKALLQLCNAQPETGHRLLGAVFESQSKNPAWAARIAEGLVGDGAQAVRAAFLETCQARVRVSDQLARQKALLLAGMVATLLSVNDIPPRRARVTGATELVEELSAMAIAASRESREPSWLFGQSWKLRESLCDLRGLISEQGAYRVAAALRGVDEDLDPAKALEVAAANLGIEAIGHVDEVLEYDPRWHEDLEGGLLGGESVRVVMRGWSQGDDVLMRAAVRPEGEEA